MSGIFNALKSYEKKCFMGVSLELLKVSKLCNLKLNIFEKLLLSTYIIYDDVGNSYTFSIARCFEW